MNIHLLLAFALIAAGALMLGIVFSDERPQRTEMGHARIVVGAIAFDG